jgi:hypothetical protein
MQVCPEGHFFHELLHEAPETEQTPELCGGQSVSTAQASLVALHFL